MLFRLEEVSKEFGGQVLFRSVSAQFNPGDRIGLIGRNGVGKSTLFDLIQGIQPADSGTVHRARGLSFARVEQIPRLDQRKTVREAALEVFQDLRELELRIETLEHEIAASNAEIAPSLGAEYEHLQTLFRMRGGYNFEARAEAVLLGLGFGSDDLQTVCSRLSGGQINRLLLGRALLRPVDVLLLDEPTNHLDLKAILWLTDYLKGLAGSDFLLVSHDRKLLDEVTQKTWELEAGTLFNYAGSFSQSRRLREERRLLEAKQFEQQQEWRRKTEDFIRRNIAGQKTKQAQSRRKQLARADWLEMPASEVDRPALRVEEAARGGRVSLRLQGAGFGYPGKPLVKDVNWTIQRGDRIAILGGNGSGKSTLLRTLMGELPLLRGDLEWGYQVVPGYFAQNADVKQRGATVYDCLRDLDPLAPDVNLRSYAARFLFREEDIYKSTATLSGGERSRLALARLFYNPVNLLLLDEPTNHLDIDSREALEQALKDYGGTLIVVSHDLYFVEQVAQQYFFIRDQQLEPLDDLSKLGDLLQWKVPASPPAKVRVSSRAERTLASLSKNERLRREKILEHLEEQVSALEEERNSKLGTLHGCSDFSVSRQISDRLVEIEAQLQDLYSEWEEVAQELD